MLLSNKHASFKKLAPLTTRSTSLRCVHICSRAPHCRTVLKTSKDKTLKASPKEIIKYSIGLPQITKALRGCSGNQRRYFSKVILESNVTPNICTKVTRLHKHSSEVNGGDRGCIVWAMETIIVFSPSRIQFRSPNGTPLTNLAEVTIRDSATVTLTPMDGTTTIKLFTTTEQRKLFQK